jgi:8-oxo-dGTP pyrophosphatase MutT (NUDIX family)
MRAIGKGLAMGDELPDWMKPHGSPWRVRRGPERLHENAWFAVDDYDAIAPTGVASRYFALHFQNGAVGAIPLHDDGTITLVGQWRFPFGAYSWELPEGGVPPDEPALDGAKREMREEAGLEAQDWRHILTIQLSNASTDEVANLYLATGLTPVAKDPDATEQLTVTRIPLRDAMKAIVKGQITDALTVAALLRLHHMAVEGELGDTLTQCVLGPSPTGPADRGADR